MTKPATGWKAKVLERHPRAVVWSKRDQPNSGQSFRCYAEPDGRELGVSMVSTGDAWRVAWINIREGVPADKAPGQRLLL